MIKKAKLFFYEQIAGDKKRYFLEIENKTWRRENLLDLLERLEHHKILNKSIEFITEIPPKPRQEKNWNYRKLTNEELNFIKTMYHEFNK